MCKGYKSIRRCSFVSFDGGDFAVIGLILVLRNIARWSSMDHFEVVLSFELVVLSLLVVLVVITWLRILFDVWVRVVLLLHNFNHLVCFALSVLWWIFFITWPSTLLILGRCRWTVSNFLLFVKLLKNRLLTSLVKLVEGHKFDLILRRDIKSSPSRQL